MPDEPLQFEVKPKAKKRPVKAKPVPQSSPPQEKSILPPLFVLLVLAGVGLYWWQGQTTARTERQASSVQEQLQTKIVDLEKQLEGTKQPEKPAFVSADCSLLGNPWISFAPESYSLSFCYKNTWGAPELKEFDIKEEHTGTKWRVTFPKVSYLSVAFETPDFALTSAEGVALTFEKQYAELKKEYAELKDVDTAFALRKIETLTVRSKDALRVYRNEVNAKTRLRTKSVQYFIPSAINGEYHLSVDGIVTGSSDLTPVDDSLKTLVDSLVF